MTARGKRTAHKSVQRRSHREGDDLFLFCVFRFFFNLTALVSFSFFFFSLANCFPSSPSPLFSVFPVSSPFEQTQGHTREREKNTNQNGAAAPRRRRRPAGLGQLDGRRGNGPRSAARKARGRRRPRRRPLVEQGQPRRGAAASRGELERVGTEAVHHSRGAAGAARAAGRGESRGGGGGEWEKATSDCQSSFFFFLTHSLSSHLATHPHTGWRPCAHRHIGVGRRLPPDREADHGEEGNERERRKKDGETFHFFFRRSRSTSNFSSSTTLSTSSL
jgi:hypothetical protein